MQGDLEAVRSGIKVLYNARGEIDSMCNSALRAVNTAAGSNSNKKFKKVEQEVTGLVNKMYDTAKKLIDAGYKLSCLEEILKKFEEN